MSVKEHGTAEQKMVLFSNRLAIAAGLTADDIRHAAHEDLIFEAGGYLVFARSVCLVSGWRDMLLAAPKSVGTDFGWSNIKHEPFPDGWTFLSRGTRTVVFPDDDIASVIIEEVSRENE